MWGKGCRLTTGGGSYPFKGGGVEISLEQIRMVSRVACRSVSDLFAALSSLWSDEFFAIIPRTIFLFLG